MDIYIDGSNLIHRLHHTCPSVSIARSRLMSWLHILDRSYRPEFMRVALDSPGTTWRHQLCPDYKGNRDDKPAELLELFELAAQDIAAHYCTVSVPGHEADDILATWAHKQFNTGGQCVIVSADKDLYQLVRKDSITLLRDFHTHAGNLTHCQFFTFDHFVEKTRLLPPQWPHYRALTGDKSDNLPGVLGIGPKHATALLERYLTIDEAVAAIKAWATVPLPSKLISRLVGDYDAGTIPNLIRLHTLTRTVPFTTVSSPLAAPVGS